MPAVQFSPSTIFALQGGGGGGGGGGEGCVCKKRGKYIGTLRLRQQLCGVIMHTYPAHIIVVGELAILNHA